LRLACLASHLSHSHLPLLLFKGGANLQDIFHSFVTVSTILQNTNEAHKKDSFIKIKFPTMLQLRPVRQKMVLQAKHMTIDRLLHPGRLLDSDYYKQITAGTGGEKAIKDGSKKERGRMNTKQ
jgi:hypothetical protein